MSTVHVDLKAHTGSALATLPILAGNCHTSLLDNSLRTFSLESCKHLVSALCSFWTLSEYFHNAFWLVSIGSDDCSKGLGRRTFQSPWLRYTIFVQTLTRHLAFWDSVKVVFYPSSMYATRSWFEQAKTLSHSCNRSILRLKEIRLNSLWCVTPLCLLIHSGQIQASTQSKQSKNWNLLRPVSSCLEAMTCSISGLESFTFLPPLQPTICRLAMFCAATSEVLFCFHMNIARAHT